MCTIQEIPFSYLVSWAKNNKNNYHGFSYLLTLNKRPESAAWGKWGDILSIVPSNKPLQKLQAAINNYQEIIISDYEKDSKVITLPANASKYTCFYDRIKAFISEYAQELDQPSNNRSKDMSKRALIIRETFSYIPSHSEPSDRSMIARALKITRQRVDQLLENIRLECHNCLTGGQVGRIIADPILVSEYNALRQKAGTMISKESFRTTAGIIPQDRRTLEFLAATLNMRVMEQKHILPVVAEIGLLYDYTKQLGDILDFFRKEVFGVRLDFELNARLQQIEDEKLQKAFISFIKNSDEFKKYKDDGYDAVTLRWDYLQTIPARLCWILYENNAFDYRMAIHENDLVEKYNDYAKRFGEEKISTTQLPPISQIRSSGCWKLMSLGKTRYWKIRQTKDEDYNLDEVIRGYLKTKDAAATFDDFLDYLTETGQRRFYPEKSLRSRYTKNGGIIEKKAVKKRGSVNRLSKNEIDERYKFILEYLNGHGKTCTVAEVFREIRNRYPETNQSTFNRWIENLHTMKEINVQKGRPTNISALSVTPPRALKDRIADSALKIVWASPTHEISINDLYTQLINTLPDNIKNIRQKISRVLHSDSRFVFSGPSGHSVVGLSKSTQLQMADPQSTRDLHLDVTKLKTCLTREYSQEMGKFNIDVQKAVDNLICIYGMGDSISDTFSFFDILTYLPLYYSKDLDNDRERTLMRESLALLELFLKSFYKLKHHADIVTKIQEEWNKRVVGLSTIISFFEQEHGYIPYRNEYSTHEERNMARVVKGIISARNQQFAHRTQEMDQSKYNLATIIHNSFLVMLYIASKY